MAVRGNKGSGNNPERDLWQTPKALFDKLNEQYKFEFDCCADKIRTKCSFFSNDFEMISPTTTRIMSWMNPPFSKSKAMFEHFFKIVKTGVAIFRCDNMETKQWQEVILKNATWILIPNKRINYEGMSGHGAVFPSALIGYNVDVPKDIEGTILYPKRVYPLDYYEKEIKITKFQSVADTKWTFYEAMENGNKESMADQFETLMIHYKRRGELMKQKDEKYWQVMRDWRDDVERKVVLLKMKVLEILQNHPRSDNYSLGGRLVSTNYVIQEEVKNIRP